MGEQVFDSAVVALEFFLCEQGMNLRVTRAADAHGLLHPHPIELALVPFVVMPRPWNEVMPRELFLASADGAWTFH